MDIGDHSTGFFALKFGAVWCAPCKVIEPSFKKLEMENPAVSFVSVDIDEHPELAKKYKIRSLPTVILLKDGKEVIRIDGAALITPLRKAFRDFVGEEQAA